MAHRVVPFWFALAALGAAGCVGGRAPASYRGSAAPPSVAPAEVAEAPVVPTGYELMGRVRAECSLTEGRATIEAEWLSDVDCTRFRLTEALRQEAADNGGELLVGRSCLSARRVGRRAVIRCEARVARSTQGVRVVARDPAAEGLRSDDPSGVEAWRIRVLFEPAGTPTARAPRRADTVEEVSVMPLAARPLGELLVTCERAPCTVEAVRAGVRVAAGRLGATHVAEVSCVEGDTPRCVGRAALLAEMAPSSGAAPY